MSLQRCLILQIHFNLELGRVSLVFIELAVGNKIGDIFMRREMSCGAYLHKEGGMRRLLSAGSMVDS